MKSIMTLIRGYRCIKMNMILNKMYAKFIWVRTSFNQYLNFIRLAIVNLQLHCDEL